MPPAAASPVNPATDWQTGHPVVYNDANKDGTRDEGEGVASGNVVPHEIRHGDGTCTYYYDRDGNGRPSFLLEPTLRASCPTPGFGPNRDGTCSAWDDKDQDGQRDADEDVATLGCPNPNVETRDGELVAFDDHDQDGQRDAHEPAFFTTEAAPVGARATRVLLHHDNLTLVPVRVPLPEAETPGVVTPDVPGTSPVRAPVPATPPVGGPTTADLGTLFVRNDASGAGLCVDFAYHGPGGPRNLSLACVPRSLLGAADPLVPRQEVPLRRTLPLPAVWEGGEAREETVWEGSDPVPVEDVEPQRQGGGAVERTTLTLEARYAYDASRHEPVTVLGEPVAYPPVPGASPSDAWWLVRRCEELSLTVTVILYEEDAQGSRRPAQAAQAVVPCVGPALASTPFTD